MIQHVGSVGQCWSTFLLISFLTLNKVLSVTTTVVQWLDPRRPSRISPVRFLPKLHCFLFFVFCVFCRVLDPVFFLRRRICSCEVTLCLSPQAQHSNAPHRKYLILPNPDRKCPCQQSRMLLTEPPLPPPPPPRSLFDMCVLH